MMHVLTASRGGSCSQNWQAILSPATDMVGLLRYVLSRRLSLGELGPLSDAFWKRSMMFCSVTFLLRPSRPRWLREMT